MSIYKVKFPIWRQIKLSHTPGKRGLMYILDTWHPERRRLSSYLPFLRTVSGVERWCSDKTLDYQSWGQSFDTRPGQDIPETLCLFHPTRGELVWNPEVGSSVLMIYSGFVKEPRILIRRRAKGLYPDLLVSDSFSLMVRTIYYV